MAYDPTAAADPFDPTTDTAKCYTNFPKQFGPPFAGHRLAQYTGRDTVVTNDDEAVDNKLPRTWVHMIKHAH